MARTRFRNPIGFLPTPVTLIIVLVYIAIGAGLLYVHHVVPSAPRKASPVAGINVTEAWRDLQVLSGGYHPYNSRRNDVVRNWLLTRIDEILHEKDALASIQVKESFNQLDATASKKSDPAPIVVFNDMKSNVTMFNSRNPGPSTYFEGTNIIVYIRGSDDGNSDWWQDTNSNEKTKQKRGVLVNAHYDSVSSGFGATDDGVGVVTTLQLIKYYSKKSHQPKRGLVALFNNGEEDFLNGAYAFMRHPISKFSDTFLNLEGAGAGGRATLFRSTDTEVTKYYGNSPHPFGTVVSADSFKRGVISSDTDYSIFDGIMGMRGLDVAFYEPRARYHTSEDSSRDTSPASLWHMLSAALATTKGLTSDIDSEFKSGEGSVPVYFDVLGLGFGLMNLQSLFGLSVALLVVAPLTLIVLSIVLLRNGKYYLFATKRQSDPRDPHSPDETAMIEFGGWKGFSRYPIAFCIASAAVVGLAFLVTKVNPLIIYSSPYSVWSMMLSAWFLVAWFFLRGADVMRPSALHRAHALGWIFLFTWVLLVAATVGMNNLKLGGGYFITIYFAAAFAAVAISYLELFGLQKKDEYAEFRRPSDEQNQPDSGHRPRSTASSQRANPSNGGPESSNRSAPSADEQEPTETTSLLGKAGSSTFNRYARQRSDDPREGHIPSIMRKFPFGEEQSWSVHLPSWLWAAEFLVFAPVALIFVGPIALVSSSALHQTLADGNAALAIYIQIAIFSILLLIPASPFIHRIAARLPFLLFLLFTATLLYNLLAFPFSPASRLKLFFRQDIDLDTGANRVALAGVDGYVQRAVAALPSTAGRTVNCGPGPADWKPALTTCIWTGLAPNVVPDDDSAGDPAVPPEKRYAAWVTVNATRSKSDNDDDDDADSGAAKIKVSGLATRACRLEFASAIADFDVNGAGEQDARLGKVAPGGTREIRLWSREWERRWTVHVRWNATDDGDAGAGASKKKKKKVKGLDGKAVCLWSDANQHGVIPAFDEVKMYLPVWSTVTKMTDGLVLGSKRFLV